MSLDEIINFAHLSENLLTSGQPDEKDFVEIAKAGVETVINLATSTSDLALADEPGTVRALGMEHLHIPVNWENPTQANLKDFMDALEARPDRKILVHCALNYRVSCFIALWKVLRQGENPDDAFKPLHEIWEPKDYPVWDDFIRQTLHDAGYATPSS